MTPEDRHDLLTLLVTLRVQQGVIASALRDLTAEVHALTTSLEQLTLRLGADDDTLDTP